MPRKLTTKEMYERCPDLAPGQVPHGNHDKYEFICRTHGNYWQVFSNHARGVSCPSCRNDSARNSQLATTESMYALCPDMVKGQESQGYHAKYEFECLNGHPNYWQEFNNHRQGSGCQKCRLSKGAQSVRAYLIGRFGESEVETEKRFDTCRSIYTLPFDFFIPSERALVEFHGMQHYMTWSLDDHSSEELKKRQQRDQIKRKWAADNGYLLIEIPHTVKDIPAYLEVRLPRQKELAA